MPVTPFLNLFGQSPIRPLEEHMSKVHACVEGLKPFFAAVFSGDWVKAESFQRDIVHLENEADVMKRELRLHLPKSLFMSVPRGDLLDLLNVQDRLANKARDIAGVIVGRKMIFPDAIIPAFTEFLKRCIDASQQANVAIHELDELFETGFSGSEVKIVEAMIAKLARIEHDTDEMQILLRQTIFNLENDLPPIHVIFIYKIIEWTGDLADGAHEVGDRLQILLAK
jgi:predicted phosphate transport protein (TIGR00153 family)